MRHKPIPRPRRDNLPPRWQAAPIWAGERAFIVCGGPSATQDDIAKLRGRRVVVINSSYLSAPWASVLVFCDVRWWAVHGANVIDRFRGMIVTNSRSIRMQQVRTMTLGRPPGLSDDPHVLNHYRTSLTAALNLLKHFGVSEIVLIGADNGPVAGKTHHHVEHPWPLRKNCWEEQREELASTVEPLKRAGIKVVNASMKSRLTFWEKQPLEGILNNAGNSQG